MIGEISTAAAIQMDTRDAGITTGTSTSAISSTTTVRDITLDHFNNSANTIGYSNRSMLNNKQPSSSHHHPSPKPLTQQLFTFCPTESDSLHAKLSKNAITAILDVVQAAKLKYDENKSLMEAIHDQATKSISSIITHLAHLDSSSTNSSNGKKINTLNSSINNNNDSDDGYHKQPCHGYFGQPFQAIVVQILTSKAWRDMMWEISNEKFWALFGIERPLFYWLVGCISPLILQIPCCKSSYLFAEFVLACTFHKKTEEELCEHFGIRELHFIKHTRACGKTALRELLAQNGWKLPHSQCQLIRSIRRLASHSLKTSLQFCSFDESDNAESQRDEEPVSYNNDADNMIVTTDALYNTIWNQNGDSSSWRESEHSEDDEDNSEDDDDDDDVENQHSSSPENPPSLDARSQPTTSSDEHATDSDMSPSQASDKENQPLQQQQYYQMPISDDSSIVNTTETTSRQNHPPHPDLSQHPACKLTTQPYLRNTIDMTRDTEPIPSSHVIKRWTRYLDLKRPLLLEDGEPILRDKKKTSSSTATTTTTTTTTTSTNCVPTAATANATDQEVQNVSYMRLVVPPWNKKQNNHKRANTEPPAAAGTVGNMVEVKRPKRRTSLAHNPEQK